MGKFKYIATVLAVLLISGFSEKKVSDDYIVGDWVCMFTDFQSAKVKDGKLGAYERQILDGLKTKVSYYKDNGHIFMDGKEIKFSFGNKNITDTVNSGKYTIRYSIKYSYISDDEFQYNDSAEFINKNTNDIVEKMKSERNCVRLNFK